MKEVFVTAEIVEQNGVHYPAIKSGGTLILLEPEYANQLGLRLVLVSLEAQQLNE